MGNVERREARRQEARGGTGRCLRRERDEARASTAVARARARAQERSTAGRLAVVALPTLQAQFSQARYRWLVTLTFC